MDKCKWCGKDFQPVIRNFGKKIFCSRKCANKSCWSKYSNERINEYCQKYRAKRLIMPCVKCGYTPSVKHHIIPQGVGYKKNKK